MEERPNTTGRSLAWAGVSGFLLILAGINILLNGLWALHASTAIERGLRGRLLFGDNDLDLWGWIYVIAGAVIFFAGFAVIFGASWARWVGVLAGFTGMLVSFFWLFTPYWPAAMVSIVLSGLVVYGLGTYGEPRTWSNPWMASAEEQRTRTGSGN